MRSKNNCVKCPLINGKCLGDHCAWWNLAEKECAMVTLGVNSEHIARNAGIVGSFVQRVRMEVEQ